jgi:hypothetical protein
MPSYQSRLSKVEIFRTGLVAPRSELFDWILASHIIPFLSVPYSFPYRVDYSTPSLFRRSIPVLHSYRISIALRIFSPRSSFLAPLSISLTNHQTFTIGRGNDIVCAAIVQVADRIKGRALDSLVENWGQTWRHLVNDSQLRWIGESAFLFFCIRLAFEFFS